MNWKMGVQTFSTWPNARQAYPLLTRVPGIGAMVTKFTPVTIPGASSVSLIAKSSFPSASYLFLRSGASGLDEITAFLTT